MVIPDKVIDVMSDSQQSNCPLEARRDQNEVFAYLSDSATYPSSEPVKRIDTHGAVVFLAGAEAYKVKRAVRFPFMDYSTLERRRAACEAEIRINKPNASTIYLGTVPITRSGHELSLGGIGQVVEWAVHMRRFDEQQTLDRVAIANGLTPDLLRRLVHAVVLSHNRAPAGDGAAATASLKRYLQQNDDAFRDRSDLFPSDRTARLIQTSLSLFQRIESVLISRGADGYVRRCHGDLHLQNLVLINGEPTLFDAVEFDDAIATGDVLYDLAFLVMDLWERDLKAEANIVLNRYLWESEGDHFGALAAMPLFLSLRAAIRAKVVAVVPTRESLEAKRNADEAKDYFACAEAFLQPHTPRIVAIGGLSGSGKSTVAAAIAPYIGRAPGALHLRSDIDRKRLFRIPEEERLPQHAYDAEVTRKVYAQLRRDAERAVKGGFTAVVDAVHATAEERREIENLARAMSVPFIGIWLVARTELLVDRVNHRSDDASDADASVVRAQANADVGAIEWDGIDASASIPSIKSAVLARLQPVT